MTYPKITPEQREAIVEAYRLQHIKIIGKAFIGNKTVKNYYTNWLNSFPSRAIQKLNRDAPDSPAGVINCFHENVEWQTVNSPAEAAYHQALKIIYPDSTIEDVCYLFDYLKEQNSELTPGLLNNLAQAATLNAKFIGTLVAFLKACPEYRIFPYNEMEVYLDRLLSESPKQLSLSEKVDTICIPKKMKELDLVSRVTYEVVAANFGSSSEADVNMLINSNVCALILLNFEALLKYGAFVKVAYNLSSFSKADVKGGMNSDAYSLTPSNVEALAKYGAFVNVGANFGSSSEADVPNTEEQRSELEHPRSNRR